MRIAVVDVAADSGGALSVLQDFLYYIQSNDEFCKANEWIVYTSMPVNIKAKNVENVVFPRVKKSWLHRLYWERFRAVKEFSKKGIDVIISLQNTAFKKGYYKQIIYFHNVLLLACPRKYSLLNASERKYAIYAKYISRYTLRSLRNADFVVVQSEIVKQDLLKKEPGLNVVIVRPNIYIDEKYKYTAELPVKGLVYPTSPAPFKRIEEIVECVRTYREWFTSHDFKVFITISGEENEYAKAIKRSIDDLTAVIQLTGFLSRDSLLGLYKNNALFISSELESFPVPLIEAAFIGNPVIAANFPYVNESTNGTSNVYLYTPGMISELMDCIRKVSKLKESESGNIFSTYNTWKDVASLVSK